MNETNELTHTSEKNSEEFYQNGFIIDDVVEELAELSAKAQVTFLYRYVHHTDIPEVLFSLFKKVTKKLYAMRIYNLTEAKKHKLIDYEALDAATNHYENGNAKFYQKQHPNESTESVGSNTFPRVLGDLDGGREKSYNRPGY